MKRSQFIGHPSVFLQVLDEGGNVVGSHVGAVSLEALHHIFLGEYAGDGPFLACVVPVGGQFHPVELQYLGGVGAGEGRASLVARLPFGYGLAPALAKGVVECNAQNVFVHGGSLAHGVYELLCPLSPGCRDGDAQSVGGVQRLDGLDGLGQERAQLGEQLGGLLLGIETGVGDEQAVEGILAGSTGDGKHGCQLLDGPLGLGDALCVDAGDERWGGGQRVFVLHGGIARDVVVE